MAYQDVPRVASERPGSQEAEAAIRTLLADIAGRKEFSVGRAKEGPSSAGDHIPGFGRPGEILRLGLLGLRLHGAQLFVRNFESPDTPYSRILICWQTGTGKSNAVASIAHTFIRSFRARAAVGEQPPTVCVISFAARETIQAELLQHPEYGFVSQVEVEELRRLRAASFAAGPGSPEDRQYSSYVGMLRRRITDRAHGGYYEFYGYKEFANRLFIPLGGRRDALQALFAQPERLGDEAFGERLVRAVRQGEVRVNEELLASLRRGLLVCDEIHNVYNILEANNYGIAIRYALDALGDEAPRAVYMSATPMTGSAAEVVDLLNLLVPRPLLPGGMPLRRSDFFTRSAVPRAASPGASDEDEESGFAVSQLREGALARIAHLAAGRVSFLLDADVESYPRRIYEGEEMAGVPYLRLTACPMSPFHARTLARARAETKSETAGLAPGAYTLYDMAFPNPAFAPDAAETDPNSYGLYLSGETPVKLAQASEEWRTAAGVVVEKGAEAGATASAYVITGPFLGPKRLPLYGTKPADVVAAAVAAIRAGPGKIMIYHHRVRMSGVLLYQEALRMSGIADEASAPTDTTLCAICGTARSEHSAGGADDASGASPHGYTPARFVAAHSDIDRTGMFRSMARYNASPNLQGYQFRILVGSGIISESLTFRAVRHLLMASLPVDFPTLIQVDGRVARKDSHAELPEDQRNVRIRRFVTTHADGRTSPELQRYIDKGREFLVIQEVERALRIYAVDGFANFPRIRAALQLGLGGELRSGLDALPYAPLVGPEHAYDPSGAKRPAGAEATFEAYGHGEREVATIAAICRVLFGARPVWTYDDLWASVRAGNVRGVNYDVSLFAEDNFALALASLARPAGEPPVAIVRTGRFYVRALVRPDGSTDLDVESYVRAPRPMPKVSVRLADYLRDAKSGQNFAVRLREYERTYLRGTIEQGVAPRPLELSLVECGAPFHYALLRQLVVAGGRKAVTSDDARVSSLYRRFRIAITVADAATAAAARVYRGPPHAAAAPDALVGYLTSEAVALCGPGEVWYNASLADFGIGRRHLENDIVVGFVVSVGEPARAGPEDPFAAFAAASAETRFKIRPPVQHLRMDARRGRGDVRTLARGAVCETRPREELEKYVARLRETERRERAAPQSRDAKTARHLASAGEACVAIRALLLAREEAARAPAGGMAGGLRWVYLFHDRAPTVSALASERI